MTRPWEELEAVLESDRFSLKPASTDGNVGDANETERTDESAAPVVVFDPDKHAKFAAAQRPLEENEEVIRAGLGTFVAVGRALADIRNSGQYREAGFATFDAYCRERWGLGKRWAYDQISAAKVYEALSVHERARLPENVEQTRPLVPLLNGQGEEALQEAWAEIVAAHDGGEAITGRAIRAHLNPAGSLAPSQRGLTDAYLSALDKLRAAFASFLSAAEKGQDGQVPGPVAERCAKYALTAAALAEALEAIGSGKTPNPEALELALPQLPNEAKR